MKEHKLRPAIEFLEERLHGLVLAINYLRQAAGMNPCAITILARPDDARDSSQSTLPLRL